MTEFVDQMHVTYENLCVDEEGNPKEVTQPEMIKVMKIDRRTFQRKFNDAIDMGLTDLRKKNNNKKDGKSAVIYRECADGEQIQ